MPDTITPNLQLVKPEVTGSVDTWGNKLNDNADKIDIAVQGNSVLAGNALLRVSTDALKRTAEDILLYKDTVVISVDAHQALVNQKWVKDLVNALMPIGTVIMWAGTVAQIPAGWALCNGQTVNGNQTPNLTDRFILQAGSSWAPGATGGDYALAYSGSTAAHAISLNEMPYHNHAVSDPTHIHGIGDPGHSHVYQSGDYSSNYGGGPGSQSSAPYNKNSGVAATGIYMGYAATGITIGYNGANYGHSHGLSLSIPWTSYWPRFYAMCYIMKVRLA